MLKKLSVLTVAIIAMCSVVLADDTVETEAGLLTVRELPDYRVEVSVDGRPLYYQDDVSSGSIERTFSINDAVKVVVVAFGSGGTACPVTYRIVDVSFGVPVLSQALGSCSDILKFKIRKASIEFDFPPYREAPAQRWSYADGELRRVH